MEKRFVCTDTRKGQQGHKSKELALFDYSLSDASWTLRVDIGRISKRHRLRNPDDSASGREIWSLLKDQMQPSRIDVPTSELIVNRTFRILGHEELITHGGFVIEPGTTVELSCNVCRRNRQIKYADLVRLVTLDGVSRIDISLLPPKLDSK